MGHGWWNQEDISYGLAKLNDGSSLITGFFTGAADFGSTTLDQMAKKMSLLLSLSGMVHMHGRHKLELQRVTMAMHYQSGGSAIVTGFFTGSVTGTTNSSD